MTDRDIQKDRLKELLLQSDPIKERDLDDDWFDGEIEDIADYLLANGVIVPPCKVGQTVYTNVAMKGWYFRTNDKPYRAEIVFMGINNSEEMGGGFINIAYKNKGYMWHFDFADIGKTVFLTKEEAEEKLREINNG